MLAGLIVHAALFGALAATLIDLPISATVKVFLAVLLAWAFLALRDISSKIDQLRKIQSDLLYFLRTTYISVEMKRLEPDNKIPSGDLLVEDVKSEKVKREVGSEMEKEMFFWAGVISPGHTMALVLYVAIAAAVFTLIRSSWPVIQEFLAQL